MSRTNYRTDGQALHDRIQQRVRQRTDDEARQQHCTALVPLDAYRMPADLVAWQMPSGNGPSAWHIAAGDRTRCHRVIPKIRYTRRHHPAAKVCRSCVNPPRPPSTLGREGSNTPRASRRPTIADLGWAAGFLEGEGCFTTATYSEALHAVQVNKEPVERLQRIFGGTITLRPHYVSQKYERNRIWHWRVTGPRARGVMLTLYSLMSAIRRLQIRKAITNYMPKRNP